MGSGGSKACRGSSAAVVGEPAAIPAAASSGGGRRSRLMTSWSFQSSCLGLPSASHGSDDDGQVSILGMRKKQGSTSRRRMMSLEPRDQEGLNCCKELKDKNFENERRCMSSNELELGDCDEANISNMPIRNGSSARDSSTQSLSTPGCIFSHFRFIPGNVSSRLGRSSSSRSLSTYPVSSSRTLLNNHEGFTSPSEFTNSLIDRNGSLQETGVFPASHYGGVHAQSFGVSPCTLPSNCPAYHVADDSQRDQIISPIVDATRDFGAMGVQSDGIVHSQRATSDVNCSDAGFLDRRPGGREPSERNVRFSRTLSVGRLRDRVLRRSSLSDLTYRLPQQGEDSDAVPVGTGPVSGDQMRASLAEDNSVTPTSIFGRSPSRISRALFGVQDDLIQTSHAGGGRYRDLLEHRSNFLERRRRIRSQVRALQRLGSRFENISGHDRSCVLVGQNQTGRCTCRSVNRNRSTTDETNARASISRIVMLAEALFEVLDEIHQQSVVLSSQPSVSPIGSVPAPNNVVDSLPMKLYNKSHRERNGETSQCYICLLEYEEGDTIRILPCHHEFHRVCVDKWLKEIHRVCPLCRGDICRYDPSSEH